METVNRRVVQQTSQFQGESDQPTGDDGSKSRTFWLGDSSMLGGCLGEVLGEETKENFNHGRLYMYHSIM